MADVRATQVGGEVLSAPEPTANVTQLSGQVVSAGRGNAIVTEIAATVFHGGNPNVKMSTGAVEVLVSLVQAPGTDLPRRRMAIIPF